MECSKGSEVNCFKEQEQDNRTDPPPPVHILEEAAAVSVMGVGEGWPCLND